MTSLFDFIEKYKGKLHTVTIQIDALSPKKSIGGRNYTFSVPESSFGLVTEEVKGIVSQDVSDKVRGFILISSKDNNLCNYHIAYNAVLEYGIGSKMHGADESVPF